MCEDAESATASDDTSKAAARSVPPPSRQSLVVKRGSSKGPLFVCGAIASAAAGFVVVFASGLGRTTPDAAPESSPPRFFEPVATDRAVPIEPVPLERPGERRFAAAPVEHVADDSAPKTSPAAFSNFSAVDSETVPQAAAEPAVPSGSPDAGDVSDASDFSDAGAVSDDGRAVAEPAPFFNTPADGGGEIARSQERLRDAATAADEAPAREPPGDVPPSVAAVPMPAAPVAPPPVAPPPVGPGVAAAAVVAAPASPPPALRSPPLESTFAAALAPMQPPAPRPTVPPTVSHVEDPDPPVPVTPPGGGQAGPVAARTPADLPRAERPPQDRIASTDVTRGFAGAAVVTPPPTVPTPPPAAPPAVGQPGVERVLQSPSAQVVGGPVQADGRPGPIQLEGVQTPQLTIEKRGPREVQVGKAARYDMVVRNVGGVAAHDVTLRDRVPLGTRLVGTSPPAAPGEGGELLWTLGSLPQGGQARVAMEVMPVEEGEVGSVASVSFRADASVRSVATRADLAIEAEKPKAVLVGSAIRLTITVRNPGTGEATGVVLEGNVPAGFTHASGPALEYDVGRLRPGEARTIDLALASTHPGVQMLKLTARADGRIETEHAVRLEVTAPTLELTASMPNRRYLQRPVTCVLSMNNAGTAAANTIELAAQLPPGMKFLRANNAGYYEETTHRVLWHLEQLPAAEVGSVEMVLVPTALGPQRIAAAARSADGLTAQVAHTVEVDGLAALIFEVGDSEDPVEVGGITEYVVRVGNQGTKAATGVRVTATLLGEVEAVDAKGPAAHRIDNLSVVFEPLANLAPAQESVYRIRVRGRREGDQRVQVQVTSDDSRSPITKEEVTRVYADR